MRKSMRKISFVFLACLLTMATLHSGAVMSKALTGTDKIPNKPLFLKNRVQPNILAVIDDSGSMDWEMMIRGAKG